MIPIIKPFLGDEEARAVADAVRSGWVSQGPRVARFEVAMAAKLGAAAGVAVSSGTAGLHLALLAAGVGPRDEVVVPSLSFVATANAVRHCGADPAFADVDAITQNLTAATVAEALSARTRAVMVVHQLGMPVDLAPIRELCEARGLALLEDAACAIGSTLNGRPIGAHSPRVVFSFHPRKLLTTGEGGMVMCRDPGGDRRIRGLRQHAMSIDDVARHGADGFVLERYTEVAFNYRMTDIQAAVGLVQLGKLDAMVSRRRELADRYARLLGGRPDLLLPGDPSYGTTNYQSYAVKLLEADKTRRDRILGAMHRAGIGVKRGTIATHLEPAWAGHPHPPLPRTERWTHTSLVLPLYHAMTAAEQERVVQEFTAALARS